MFLFFFFYFRNQRLKFGSNSFDFFARFLIHFVFLIRFLAWFVFIASWFVLNHGINCEQSSIFASLREFVLSSRLSDHAGLVLVTSWLISGAKFHSWCRSIRLVLNIRYKFGFIDSMIPNPLIIIVILVLRPVITIWFATWLMSSVFKKIGQSFLFMSTAESIWKNLLTWFEHDDVSRVYDIEQCLSIFQ